MPLHRRLPKRGFNNIFGKEFTVLNVGKLDSLEGDHFDAAQLLKDGVIRKLLVPGLETNRGEERWFFVHAERSVRLETIAICIAVTMPL